MAYDDSREALYHPERRAAFVNAAAAPPFNPNATEFNPVNAWWLANFSHIAYYDLGPLVSELAGVGMQRVLEFDRDGTQGYLARCSSHAVLAFRGTEVDELADLRTNAKVVKDAFPPGGRVHKGFMEALDEVWGDVSNALGTLSVPVWFTGHSLGAALATLAAARYPAAKLMTFASPRLGDAAFAALNELAGSVRVVNCCDIVPRVPPRAFMYEHTPTWVFITATGARLDNPSRFRRWLARWRGSIRYRLRCPLLRRGTVLFRSLADHAIVNYTDAMRRLAQIP